MEVTVPRFILAEFNTHRVFSRNSASSRAIPVERRIAQVRESPFVPEAFTKNRKGMQATGSLEDRDAEDARNAWLRAAENACHEAQNLMNLGVHKQHANRILEPYVWHTVVVSATEWENFFALRTHKDAQPEMQIVAKMMREAYEASAPRAVESGAWHLPYVEGRDVVAANVWGQVEGDCTPDRLLLAQSVVRCAAVSYERQHAERTYSETMKRHDDLLSAGHMSPFEHQAQVDPKAFGACDQWAGNFRKPWFQYRKMLRGEGVWRPRS
jgi:thymidylate synthase ThyX